MAPRRDQRPRRRIVRVLVRRHVVKQSPMWPRRAAARDSSLWHGLAPKDASGTETPPESQLAEG